MGVGRLPGAAPEIAAEIFRLDRLGVLIPASHPYARRANVPVSELRGETLLLADEEQAPEFNAFVAEVCRSAGFFPTLFPGSVQTLRAAVDLVAQGRCVLCTPASTAAASSELTWRPLGPAVPRYPWSILWRSQDPSRYAVDLVATAREMSVELGWRDAVRERAS